jgi:hypothetical protein
MRLLPAIIATTLGAFAHAALSGEIQLTGAEEVPAVTTSATGTANITINADKSVSGSVKTQGIKGIAAHVHQAPAGKNGPPIITLVKSSDDVWSVPEGAKLTDEQYASYQAGELYINVHSAEHKSGEIRAQLRP